MVRGAVANSYEGAMTTFTSIIGLWPHKSEFATDLGVPYERAKAWAGRDSIPGQYFAAVAMAAQKRGHTHVTVQLLSDIAAKRAELKAA